MEPPDRKTCRRCGKTKPAHCYDRDRRRRDGLQNACKVCERIRVQLRRETPEYREYLGDYLKRPEVVAAKKASQLRYQRTVKFVAMRRARLADPVVRLRRRISSLRSKLRRIADPESRAIREETLALYLADLKRLEARTCPSSS